MAVYYKTQVTLEFLSTVPLVNNPDSMHSMIASGQAIHRALPINHSKGVTPTSPHIERSERELLNGSRQFNFSSGLWAKPIHRVISAAPAAIDLATLDAALAGYDAERSGPFRAQVDLVEAAGT